MTQQLNKLGKHMTTGKVVFIRDADNGLACNCICAECGGRFEAIQGQVNEWHFRHYNETNCKGGQETLVHKLAKKFIAESFQISLPYHGTISYNQQEIEKKFHSIRPDVTAITNEQKIFFEVLVNHPVELATENFYKDGEFKSVEIDLKNHCFTTPENLYDEVLNNIENKRLIFWEKKKVTETSTDNFLIGLLIIFLVWLGFNLLSSPTRRNRR